MKGWFDAFRNDGGPTLYTYSNRTPVTGDVNTISIILVFSTLLVAFLVIFPGIRKEVGTNWLVVFRVLVAPVISRHVALGGWKNFKLLRLRPLLQYFSSLELIFWKVLETVIATEYFYKNISKSTLSWQKQFDIKRVYLEHWIK